MGTKLNLMLLGAVAAILLAVPSMASGAVLSRSGSTVYYVADQGERNDLVVEVDVLLGQPVYSFTDNDAVPIRLGGGLCDFLRGKGVCVSFGVTYIWVNLRDRDDTAQIATGGPAGPVPAIIGTTLIGGRGQDILMGGNGPDRLKGNNGRDSLRGRKGADFYKGGRGSDTLQTLDGLRDAFISCGDGRRDLIRLDPRIDPRPKSCELGNHRKGRRGKRP